MQSSPVEQVFLQNSNRILQFYSRASKHLTNFRRFHPTHWIVKKSRDIGIRLQDTLVSTLPYYKYKLYPCGDFDCAACNTNVRMDEHAVSYYREEYSGFVCDQCKGEMAISNVPIMEAFHDMKTIQVPKMVLIDECMSDEAWEVYMEEKRDVAKKAADVWGATYLHNWTIEDVRWRILAKRGVRAFRRNWERRIREKIFRVFYQIVGMDIHAALVHAKEIKL